MDATTATQTAAKKILVADDDAGVVKALQLRLQAAGFEVITASDAPEAIDLAIRHRPDLLVLDVNMPASTEFGVQKKLGEIEQLAKMPVIYLTGDSAIIERGAQRLGAFAVVRKPFETSTLLKTIRGALGV